jgi:hypothetical protein
MREEDLTQRGAKAAELLFEGVERKKKEVRHFAAVFGVANERMTNGEGIW